MELIYMESPDGEEIKEVEPIPAKLTPLMAAGWHQIPAPTATPKTPVLIKEENQWQTSTS